MVIIKDLLAFRDLAYDPMIEEKTSKAFAKAKELESAIREKTASFLVQDPFLSWSQEPFNMQFVMKRLQQWLAIFREISL